MSKLPLDLFLPPKQKKEPKIAETKFCKECKHWLQWKNYCQLGYNTKADSKSCSQALPKY